MPNPITNSLLQDLIPEDLLDNNRVIISAQQQYCALIQSAKQIPPPLRTPFPAKNLDEFFNLVKKVINDNEYRRNVPTNLQINYTEEEPDYLKDLGPTITFSLVVREPGAAGKGAPMHNTVKNYVPILREEVNDPENPGYKKAILGYWHDNEVKFTVWAKTNKVANDKALWFEGLMQEYSWYFASQGVARLLFLKREADLVSEVDGQKLYASPIHFYVRTETLTTISQKTFELIEIGANQPTQ